MDKSLRNAYQHSPARDSTIAIYMAPLISCRQRGGKERKRERKGRRRRR
jgi:hypothetical protein